MKYLLFLTFILSTFVKANVITGSELEDRGTLLLKYRDWDIRYSCVNRSPELMHTIIRDQNKVLSPFNYLMKERGLPKNCFSPTSKDSFNYLSSETGYFYTHGYLYSPLYSDHDKYQQITANLLTNTLPIEVFQSKDGLWKNLEDRAHCVSKNMDVEMWTGVIWGNSKDKHLFANSHSVVVPEKLFRIHRYGKTNKVFAWIIPNSPDANFDNEHSYRVMDEHIHTNMHLIDFDLSHLVTNVKEADPYRECSGISQT